MCTTRTVRRLERKKRDSLMPQLKIKGGIGGVDQVESKRHSGPLITWGGGKGEWRWAYRSTQDSAELQQRKFSVNKKMKKKQEKSGKSGRRDDSREPGVQKLSLCSWMQIRRRSR